METTETKGPGVEQLFAVGAHFAQQKARRHPTMKPFIIGAKAKTEIFDLAKTDAQFSKAKEVIAALARDGKTVLFVGGKSEASEAVKAVGRRLAQPFVAGRWLGGTITNFPEIKKRIDRLSDLLSKRESGELAKMYTKLERLFIDREIDKLSLRLEGITALAKRPDAFVVVDPRREAHAIREAKSAGIPVIGIMSSDCDITDAAYPIVMNDASRETIALALGELASAFEEGRKG